MYRVAGEKKPVKLAAFGEERRFGRVQVLGLAPVDDAAAEADDAPAAVVDRKHHAVAKTIVSLAAVRADHETGFDQHLVVVIRKHGGERLPIVGRVADAKPCGDFAGEAARPQIVDRAR